MSTVNIVDENTARGFYESPDATWRTLKRQLVLMMHFGCTNCSCEADIWHNTFILDYQTDDIIIATRLHFS